MTDPRSPAKAPAPSSWWPPPSSLWPKWCGPRPTWTSMTWSTLRFRTTQVSVQQLRGRHACASPSAYLTVRRVGRVVEVPKVQYRPGWWHRSSACGQGLPIAGPDRAPTLYAAKSPHHRHEQRRSRHYSTPVVVRIRSLAAAARSTQPRDHRSVGADGHLSWRALPLRPRAAPVPAGLARMPPMSDIGLA
jgi:hypothetical protein